MAAGKPLLSRPIEAPADEFDPNTGKMWRSTAKDLSEIRVLSVGPNVEDHLILRRILNGLPWDVFAVANCKEAIRQLSQEPVSLIFCESVLEDGTWKDILSHIRGDAHPPLVIVTSRLADEFLWAEVLNLGGYDVVAKPLNPAEVRHVFTTASLWLTRPASPPRRVAAG